MIDSLLKEDECKVNKRSEEVSLKLAEAGLQGCATPLRHAF